MSFAAAQVTIAPVSQTVKFQSKRTVVQKPVFAVRASAEESSRRAALSLFAAAGAALVAESAQAISLPGKEAYFKAGANASGASMSGYTLEGTKKKGISAKQRRAIMAKARESATK
ncbi:hypothetical protein CYMTET_13521 [Cymbomonas tetramitiformis]|uniref:Uncharacterized protein n=1 Tax=Cymbomonas tetramitiformis TaxID=36881 RepID=A0AAE0GJF0_9CHLO|nr:hypothetical protein CYMTET_13521 [Cymbomonas tetramitiformis]